MARVTMATGQKSPLVSRLWDVEVLPGPGGALGIPSPLGIQPVWLKVQPAPRANPQAVSAWIPSLNQSPSLVTSLAVHTPESLHKRPSTPQAQLCPRQFPGSWFSCSWPPLLVGIYPFSQQTTLWGSAISLSKSGSF